MSEKEISVTNKIAVRALLIALAMVLSYIESQIQFVSLVPGIKLGLTNLVVMVALYRISDKEAIMINVVRIILVGVTFGNLFSMAYSMAGGLLSGVVMLVMKRRTKMSMTTVSVLGGISHNVGQILVAMIVLQTHAVLYYLLVLWITGIVAGVVIGLVSAQIVERLPKNLIR
ncbi:MAG: Gx transporter family protein [Eubacterium sp.]|nr:Gx transporter family protein [Eubacterium sp.]